MKRQSVLLAAFLVLFGCGGDPGGGGSKSISISATETTVVARQATTITLTQNGYNAYAYSLSLAEPDGGTITSGSGDPPANGITRTYTAPSTAGTYHIIGTITDQNNRQATATLAIEVTDASSS